MRERGEVKLVGAETALLACLLLARRTHAPRSTNSKLTHSLQTTTTLQSPDRHDPSLIEVSGFAFGVFNVILHAPKINANSEPSIKRTSSVNYLLAPRPPSFFLVISIKLECDLPQCIASHYAPGGRAAYVYTLPMSSRSGFPDKRDLE